MNQYLELKHLSPAGIKAKPLPQIAPELAALAGKSAEPCRGLDQTLLAAAIRGDAPHPLLCLRCRISYALEAWLRATHSKHDKMHGLELLVMASYALDDEGELRIRTGPTKDVPFVYAELASLPKGLISPF